MGDFRGPAARLVWVAGAAAVAVVIAGTAALSAAPNSVTVIAMCPPGEVPNPAGYGCVPALSPGGAFVGAPTEEQLSACHGGNLYFCVDPYGRP
jgi:hypothetical protein